MNEVFQRVGKAGRAGAEMCWWPTSHGLCFIYLFFSSALPALVDVKDGDGEGALRSSTGIQLVGFLAEPASSYPEADHMPFAQSE